MSTRSSFGAQGKRTKEEFNGAASVAVAQSAVQHDSVKMPAVRRRIPPASGRALEALGHAIEYLADEYAFTTAQMGILDSGDPRIEAIQLLMSLNRQVYYSCPKVEPALPRFAGWLFGSSVTRQPKRTSA